MRGQADGRNVRIHLSWVEGHRRPEGWPLSRHVRPLGYLDELEKACDDPAALHPLRKADKRGHRLVGLGSAVPSACLHRALGKLGFS